jgi:hypothetical protein
LDVRLARDVTWGASCGGYGSPALFEGQLSESQACLAMKEEQLTVPGNCPAIAKGQMLNHGDSRVMVDGQNLGTLGQPRDGRERIRGHPCDAWKADVGGSWQPGEGDGADPMCPWQSGDGEEAAAGCPWQSGDGEDADAGCPWQMCDGVEADVGGCMAVGR